VFGFIAKNRNFVSSIKIIYEDDALVVINKPASLLAHSAGSTKFEARNSKQFTVADWLAEKYPEIKKVGDLPAGRQVIQNLRPGIVHRLDKDTSGVFVVAKNQPTFEFLKKQFQERKIKKTYLALVYGEVRQKEGFIDLPLGKARKDFRKRAVAGTTRGGLRDAITEYKVVKFFKHPMLSDYTLLEVYPKTGRTHQIRVHLKAIGHPIVCDPLYAPKRAFCPAGLKRQFLHAFSLEFNLPAGARTRFEADMPQDLQNVLNMLK
jgi:23S rRNA pseudouridine1911/1915/1917 synthase